MHRLAFRKLLHCSRPQQSIEVCPGSTGLDRVKHGNSDDLSLLAALAHSMYVTLCKIKANASIVQEF